MFNYDDDDFENYDDDFEDDEEEDGEEEEEEDEDDEGSLEDEAVVLKETEEKKLDSGHYDLRPLTGREAVAKVTADRQLTEVKKAMAEENKQKVRNGTITS